MRQRRHSGGRDPGRAGRPVADPVRQPVLRQRARPGRVRDADGARPAPLGDAAVPDPAVRRHPAAGARLPALDRLPVQDRALQVLPALPGRQEAAPRARALRGPASGGGQHLERLQHAPDHDAAAGRTGPAGETQPGRVHRSGGHGRHAVPRGPSRAGPHADHHLAVASLNPWLLMEAAFSQSPAPLASCEDLAEERHRPRRVPSGDSLAAGAGSARSSTTAHASLSTNSSEFPRLSPSRGLTSDFACSSLSRAAID